MLSRAIKCDYCEKVTLLSKDEYDVFQYEGAANGWLRLFVNNPKRASYTDEQINASKWLDLCSISCTNLALYKLGE